MYCLKPPVKRIPQGDWFCVDCRPKEQRRTARMRKRPPKLEEFVNEEPSEEEDDVDEDEDADSEDDEESDEDESSGLQFINLFLFCLKAFPSRAE